MDELNTKSATDIVQVAPASVVPPGSANPIQGAGAGIQGPGGKMMLRNKSVETETPNDLVADDRKDDGAEEYGDLERIAEDLRKQVTVDVRQIPVSQSEASRPEASDLEQDVDSEELPIELPDLTPEQLVFLTSERYREASNMIKREFGMEDEDLSFLSEMEHAVLTGVIDLEQFIVAMQGEFPRLNDEEKSRLIGILLAYRFEPFSDQLHPSPRQAARSKNIKMANAPYYRVYTKPLTFRGAANEVARMANIDLMGQTQERLRDAIISRMKGIRTDGQLEELFQRSPERAGLGLPEDRARLAREALVELIERAKLMSEDEYAKWLNDQIHQKQASEKPVVKNEVKDIQQQEDEKEIEEIARHMPERVKSAETALARSVALIVSGLSWKTGDEYLNKRLEGIVSTRLRDIRSKNEVFIKLTRDDKVGGMGMERKLAEQIADEIEEGYRTYRGEVVDEESRKLKTQMLEQERKIEERKRRESEEHAKWYEEKVKNRQDQAKSGLELLKVIARGQTSPIHPLDVKEDAKERANYGELVPSDARSVSDLSDAGVARSSSFLTPSRSAKTEKGGSALERSDSNVAKPSVKVSIETARASEQVKSNAKPKMQDVVQVRRTGGGLSGPLQEIGHMTLEGFRRLAPDAKSASKRLLELASLLGQESYERRIEAIEAWRSSPLQKMYLELVAGAFLSKKTVTELADAKRASGEQAPTPEEIMAIVDLNRSLSL